MMTSYKERKKRNGKQKLTINSTGNRKEVIIMGMYTELVMACELKPVKECINPLQALLQSNLDYEYPDYEIFRCPRSKYMFTFDSYYFDGDTNTTLRYDAISNAYYLTVRCNFKNYNDEIDKFLNWLAPYIASQGFLGYYRYEEDIAPTLIYCTATNDILCKEVMFK